MTKLLSVAAITLLLFVPGIVEPDDNTGVLEGRVTDENEIAIPGAKVSARNTFSAKVDVTMSDTNGFYRLLSLEQGRYSVFATAEGYGCVWVFNVAISRGETTKLNFALADAHKGGPSSGCN